MDSKSHWTQYWQQGHKTSFGENLQNNYQGKLRQHWLDIFASLQPSQSVLDLCTGNATLIRLAKDLANNFESIHFTGVDYAKIEIDESFSNLENIKFLDSINVESLPFNKATFELVISNFGVEYSELDLTIPEISRVLKKGGRIELICHHEQSSLITESRQCVEMLAKIHQSDGVLMTLKKLVAELDKELPNDREIFRNKLNEQLTELQDVDKKSLQDSDILMFLRHLFSKNSIDKTEDLRKFEEESLGYQARLKVMTEAALSNDDLTRIRSSSLSCGIELLFVKEIFDGSELLAYHISALKN